LVVDASADDTFVAVTGPTGPIDHFLLMGLHSDSSVTAEILKLPEFK